jgi:hypothetical protein
VKLSGSLPGDDRNGLSALATQMLDNPEATHIVVAVVDCTKITTDVASGDVVPTARICAIEAFNGATADAAELRRLWRRAYERRTGKVELPLELERELDAISVQDDDEDEGDQ